LVDELSMSDSWPSLRLLVWMSEEKEKRAEGRLGPRFERALSVAFELHAGQTRKGTDTPYLGHLLGVSSIVIDDGGPEDEAIAALLHDVVEDSEDGAAVLERIREDFGDRVAAIVMALSDAVGTGREKEAWEARKAAYLEKLRLERDPAVLRVSVADKLHNAQSILLDLRRAEDPAEVWGRFNAEKDKQLWLYLELAAIYLEYLPGALADEYAAVVASLQAERNLEE
jgi:(p)ppGpp synthase/HD superfamily hydrolase